jgi:hypothetical protein
MAFMLAPQARARRYADLEQIERSFGSGGAGSSADAGSGASAWLESGFRVPAAWAAGIEPRRSAFPAGGYFVLGAHRDQPHEVQLVFDAAPLGYLSIAAHGHADCLSFVLSLGGHPVLVDPGTCCYHEDAVWRDHFRGTSAHNTLRVDGLDQSESGGPFMWLRKATPTLEAARTSGPLQLVRARHDGYRRLSDPVTHAREVRLDAARERIEVVDRIDAAGAHRLERFWHFAPACQVAQKRAGLFLVSLPHVQLRMRCYDAEAVHVLRGSHAPRNGWFSPGYGRMEPATALVFRSRSRGSITLRTEFEWEFQQ